MPKKLLIPFLVILLLVTSCKKDTNNTKATNGKSLDFKVAASASFPEKIVINIIRPATGGTGVDIQIAYISVSNVIAPYEYTATKLQTGDQVDIQVYTTQNQPIIGSLTINGAIKPSTVVNLNTTASQSMEEWVYDVD